MNIRHLVAILVIFLAATSAQATEIEIYPFSTANNSGALSRSSPGSTGSQSGTNFRYLGGFPEYQLTTLVGTGTTFRYNLSDLRVESGDTDTPTARFILDGSSFSGFTFNPDPNGLGTDGNGEDLLTSTNGDRFRLNVSFLEAAGLFDLTIDVWSDGGANHASVASSNIATVGVQEFLFDDFSGIDFTDVSALVLEIGIVTPGTEVRLDEFLVPMNAAVPEPPMLALLALGGLLVSIRRRYLGSPIRAPQPPPLDTHL